jgi:nitrogen fixation NifU-like protein
MDLDSLYQEIILDHYRSPHNAGLRDPFEAEVHHVNPTCGDEITLRVHLDGKAFEAHEAFLELMQGRGKIEPDEEVLEDGIAFAGVAQFPARIKCALLSWMAFKDATAQIVAKEKS